MASGLAVAQRFTIRCRGCARHQRRAPTRGRMPGAAPDRRAWKQVSATARDLRALPDRNAVSQLRPDLHGRADAMPRRAPASAKSSLVRAPPKKHSARQCRSPRREAPAAERCSNAILECSDYRRFAVTSQLQNVADFIPAMCSSSGSSDAPSGRAQGSFAGTVQNELDQQETMTRGLAVVIFFVIRSAFVSGFLASASFK